MGKTVFVIETAKLNNWQRTEVHRLLQKAENKLNNKLNKWELGACAVGSHTEAWISEWAREQLNEPVECPKPSGQAPPERKWPTSEGKCPTFEGFASHTPIKGFGVAPNGTITDNVSGEIEMGLKEFTNDFLAGVGYSALHYKDGNKEPAETELTKLKEHAGVLEAENAELKRELMDLAMEFIKQRDKNAKQEMGFKTIITNQGNSIGSLADEIKDITLVLKRGIFENDRKNMTARTNGYIDELFMEIEEKNKEINRLGLLINPAETPEK